MVNHQVRGAILMLNGKRRAAHGICCAQAGDDAFDQRRLAAAQIAEKRDHLAGMKKSSEGATQFHRLFGADSFGIYFSMFLQRVDY